MYSNVFSKIKLTNVSDERENAELKLKECSRLMWEASGEK